MPIHSANFVYFEKLCTSLLHDVHKFGMNEHWIKRKSGCLCLAPQVQTEPQGQTDWIIEHSVAKAKKKEEGTNVWEEAESSSD